MTANTRQLQRLIHVGCSQLGIDADLRHDLQLVATGKASLADMTEAELELVVAALRDRGFKPGFKGGEKGRHAPAPRADLRYVHVLWGLLAAKGAVRAPGRAGLNAFIQKRFGKAWGSVPIDVDALRDWQQIADLIDALRAWCDREGIPTTKPEEAHHQGGRQRPIQPAASPANLPQTSATCASPTTKSIRAQTMSTTPDHPGEEAAREGDARPAPGGAGVSEVLP